jgi:WD40 repeat protein
MMNCKYLNMIKIFLIIILGLSGGCNMRIMYPSPGETHGSPDLRNTISPILPLHTDYPTQSVTATHIPTVSLTTEQWITITSTATNVVIQPDINTGWDGNAEKYGTYIITERSSNDSAFFLYNSEGTIIRKYQLDPQIFNPLMPEKITDECGLIALVSTDEGHKIIQIDINGAVQKNVFLLKFEDSSGNHRYIPKISPLENYVTYVVFSGELYYDSAEYQDIEIAPVNQPDKSIQITSHGGAWKEGGEWSPDGTQIAYTDYDDQGILQIYITQINTWNQITITAFTNPNSRPGPISWSPHEDRLAVMVEDQDQEREVWIVSIPQRKANRLNLPAGLVTIADKIYWSDDGSKVLLFVGDYTNSNFEGLYWFDVENNQIIHVLTVKQAAEINPHAGSFYAPFPLTLDLSEIAFKSNIYEWFSYDAKSGHLDPVTWLNTKQWGTFLNVSMFRENIFSCYK